MKFPPVDRAVIHRLLRERGQGDRLDRLIAMMDGHKATLNEAISIVSSYPGDGFAEQIVCDAKAALRAIEKELDLPVLGVRSGSLGTWGRNGNAARIEGLLTSAQHFAKREAAR